VRMNGNGRRDLVSLSVLAVLALPAPLVAQVGSEFRANTYTTGDQGYHQGSIAVAGTPATFVVVWEDPAKDGSSYGIFGRRFTSASKPLPQGGEFRVNASTTGTQRYPAVAASSAGSFVVVWESRSLDNSYSSVVGQRFDSSGVAAGPEFRVNTYTTTFAIGKSPAVASDASGNVIVVWKSYYPDGSTYNIFGQRYASSGAPLGGEFEVNTTTDVAQSRPSVAFAGGGGSFVVVWQDDKFDAGGEIVGQRYSGTGAPLGTEFRVNTYGTGGQTYPSVAADSAGDFMVAWQSENQYGVENTIQARRFASSGAPLGSGFRVDTTLPGPSQLRPKVASDENGNFTVAWQSSGTVFARRFAPTGAPLAAPFIVPSTAFFERGRPAVANAGAAFVVVWGGLTSSAGGREVFGKRYPGQGDIDGNGVVDVNDVFYLINFLFAGGPDPIGPGDTSGDGAVDGADVFYLINYLFAGGPFPK
jgi:hypothetical protein